MIKGRRSTGFSGIYPDPPSHEWYPALAVELQIQLERLFPGDENNERLPRLVAMLERAWALGGVRLDQDDLERELRALDRRSPETDEARTLLEVTRTILEWHCTAPQGGGSDELREKL